jgi:hypothetical protein
MNEHLVLGKIPGKSPKKDQSKFFEREQVSAPCFWVVNKKIRDRQEL